MNTDKCVICDSTLPDSHPGRHNASPVKEGVCCTMCNDTVVIQKRIELMFATMNRYNAMRESNE